MGEDRLTRAEWHVLQAENLVRKQRALIEKLQAGGRQLAQAKRVLTTLETSLELARAHVARDRKA
jgi:hypothetical protein